MKKKLGLLMLICVLVLSAPSVGADGDFYVIAGGGKAGTQIRSVPYTITSPGLYCLAQNLSYSTTLSFAITVAASDVTLDLMGFCLTGPGKNSGPNHGININEGIDNVEIRNGTINAFGGHGIIKYNSTNYVGSVTDQESLRDIPDSQAKEAMEKSLEGKFDRMFKEINAKLI